MHTRYILTDAMRERVVEGEWMDRPDVDPVEHLKALAGLRRINRLSGAAKRMVRPIVALAKRGGMERLTLWDVACGGGEVPIAMALAAERAGVKVELTLLDRSETALEAATKAARRAGLACRRIQGEAALSLPDGGADVVTNSLFLHHLATAEEAAAVLGRMRACARRMVVVSDLRRSRAGLLAAWAGCRVLSRSAIVHYDGPASVRAAWTVREVAGLAKQAGMNGVRVERCWPWRMLLVWEQDSEVDRGRDNTR